MGGKVGGIELAVDDEPSSEAGPTGGRLPGATSYAQQPGAGGQ